MIIYQKSFGAFPFCKSSVKTNRQALDNPKEKSRSGAGVGVGMLSGAGDSLTRKYTSSNVPKFYKFQILKVSRL